MAFNPSPKVAEARKLGEKYNQDYIIILMVKDNTIEGISYGSNKQLCDGAGLLMHVAYETVKMFMEKVDRGEINENNIKEWKPCLKS